MEMRRNDSQSPGKIATFKPMKGTAKSKLEQKAPKATRKEEREIVSSVRGGPTQRNGMTREVREVAALSAYR